jgi:arylsulfatase A-like enzyme
MLYEGGIRVPLLVRQPGLIAPGTRCDVPAISVDFLPTFCALARAPVGDEVLHDGVSLLPLLRGERPDRLLERDLYWHFPGYLEAERSGATWRTTPAAVIRRGDWKWIEFYETRTGELYDLRADAGEAVDQAQQEPELAALLRSRLHRWQRRVDAPLPTRPESSAANASPPAALEETTAASR